MKEKIVRIRIDENIYKDYKFLCVDLDLSIPKQTEMLIKQFLQVQRDNLKIIKTMKGLK